ncbi:MAG: uncharacterized protein JWP87_2245 [Labilithrix sp.]|nr:uncharacterized protein [Labilithrix sp.]
MRRLTERLASLAAFALVAMVAVPAAAAPKGSGAAKAACLAAHEEAQSLRTQKKPHAAREKLIACARVECPTVVRKECGEQLAIVEKDAPTVALEARDDSGMAETAVTVSIDGKRVADGLTGAAVDVEPGEHVFRFERGDGKAIEQHVLVVEGEKNRKVVADFATLAPKPPVHDGPPARGTDEPKKIPVLAYVAGGVAIAAIGSFTFFALSGKGAEKDLVSSCSPNCTDDALSPVKRDYLIADVSLVIGVVAAAAAVILALPALTDSPKTSASIARSAPPPWMPRMKVRALP